MVWKKVICGIFMLTVFMTVTECDRNVDDKIEQVKKGMSAVDVFELLGKPASAWGSPMDNMIALVYEGRYPYSILLNGSTVSDVYEGRLGGPNNTRMNQKIKIVSYDNAIEFRR